MGQMISSAPAKQEQQPEVKKMGESQVDFGVTSPRFSASNVEEIQQGIAHLDEHGYAVFGDVLSKENLDLSVDLFWKYLETLKHAQPIRRNDPETWEDNWPGSPDIGLLNDQGMGQSEFIWSVRGNPNIKKVFSHIWNSDELFVSFDGAGCFRDWHLNKHWKTVGNWYHCDQNPLGKVDRCSIQGLVSLTDSNESTGGLVIVPGSHRHFEELQAISNPRRRAINYVYVPSEHPLVTTLTPRLIKCKAGDLVVWDSRCIHCNTPAETDAKPAPKSTTRLGLLRLVTYICMSPASMFVPGTDECETLEEFREKREEFVRKRITCSHWPLQLVGGPEEFGADRAPLKLNAYQHSLIVGKPLEYAEGTAEVLF